MTFASLGLYGFVELVNGSVQMWQAYAMIMHAERSWRQLQSSGPLPQPHHVQHSCWIWHACWLLPLPPWDSWPISCSFWVVSYDTYDANVHCSRMVATNLVKIAIYAIPYMYIALAVRLQRVSWREHWWYLYVPLDTVGLNLNLTQRAAKHYKRGLFLLHVNLSLSLFVLVHSSQCTMREHLLHR